MKVCLNTSPLFALAISALISTSVCAENVVNFYERDSAKTTFAEEAKPTATPELGYAPARMVLSESALDDTFYLAQAKQQAKQNVEDLDLTKNTGTRTMSRDEILKAFGDPKHDLPVNGVDNAPAPFKAVQRALELGDDQLAYEYAKQYVQYIRKVGRRANQIDALVAQVMKNEEAAKSTDADADKITDLALATMHNGNKANAELLGVGYGR